MKVSRALSVIALAASTLAQDFIIQLSQTKVVLGQSLDVNIIQPISATNPFENVAIALGIQHCGDTPCSTDDNNEALGQIVKTSLFSPKLNASSPANPPSQTFSLPITGEAGFATLHASAMILTGAGPLAIIIAHNASLTLISS